MEKIIRKIVGKETHVFTVQGETFFDVMMESQKLSFGDITHCRCGSQNLTLRAHITDKKKYKYVTVRCLDCKSVANFGVKSDQSDCFYIKMVEGENGKKVIDWKNGFTEDEN